MKRTHLFGTMMACTLAAAVSVAAQDRPSQTSSDRDAKAVVVTGCLKSDSTMTGTAGTAGTAGTSGSTAGAMTRGSFILTDAMVSSGSGSTGSTMSGMSHGNNQQLRVTSVRQVASSCSGQ